MEEHKKLYKQIGINPHPKHYCCEQKDIFKTIVLNFANIMHLIVVFVSVRGKTYLS